MDYPANYFHADLQIRTTAGLRTSRLYYAASVAPSHYNHMQEAAGAIQAAWGGILAPVLSNSCSVERVKARYVHGGVDIEAVSLTNPITGTGDASGLVPEFGGIYPGEMPDEACLVFRRLTGELGRERRGRFFIAGISETVNSSGRIADGHRGDVIDIAEFATNLIAIAVPADEEAGVIAWNATLAFRHYDRKNNQLLPVVKCLALDLIGSRIDRRRPYGLDVLVPLPT